MLISLVMNIKCLYIVFEKQILILLSFCNFKDILSNIILHCTKYKHIRKSVQSPKLSFFFIRLYAIILHK